MTPIDLYGIDKAYHLKEIGLLTREDLEEHFSSEYSLLLHMKINYSLYYHHKILAEAQSLTKREYNLAYNRADSMSDGIIEVPAILIIKVADYLSKHDTIYTRLELRKTIKEIQNNEKKTN